jgi:hypothetical protein
VCRNDLLTGVGRHRSGTISTFVPRADHRPPIPDWKRFEMLRPARLARDLELLDGDESTSDGYDGSSGYAD